MLRHSDGCGNGCRSWYFWHHSIARHRKPPTWRKNLWDICYTSWFIAHCLKCRCHSNMGHPEVNLYDAVKLVVPINHTTEPNMKWIGWSVSEILPFDFELFEMSGRSLVAGRRSVVESIHTLISSLRQERSVRGVKKTSFCWFCTKMSFHRRFRHLGISVTGGLRLYHHTLSSA